MANTAKKPAVPSRAASAKVALKTTKAMAGTASKGGGGSKTKTMPVKGGKMGGAKKGCS